jgi:hypothetical protein
MTEPIRVVASFQVKQPGLLIYAIGKLHKDVEIMRSQIPSAYLRPWRRCSLWHGSTFRGAIERFSSRNQTRASPRSRSRAGASGLATWMVFANSSKMAFGSRPTMITVFILLSAAVETWPGWTVMSRTLLSWSISAGDDGAQSAGST